MLNRETVLCRFAFFTGLRGDALEHWRGLCESNAAWIERRIKTGVNITAEMDVLCGAAAASAYAEYTALQRCAQAEELRVGDITLRGTSAAQQADAERICSAFLQKAASLLQPDCPALLTVEAAT